MEDQLSDKIYNLMCFIVIIIISLCNVIIIYGWICGNPKTEVRLLPPCGGGGLSEIFKPGVEIKYGVSRR